MILFYVDESGTGWNDRQTRYFILSSVAIEGAEWHMVEREITLFKRQIFSWAKPADWEIKGRDLRRGENFFAALSWVERLEIVKRFSHLVTELPCQFFSVQIDKSFLHRSVTDDQELYRMAFWALLELMTQYLTERDDYGMMLFDSRTDLHTDIKDRRLVEAYQEWVKLTSGAPRFLELPWFGSSSFYSGLQIADFLSYFLSVDLNEITDETRGSVRHYELRYAIETVKSKTRRKAL